MLRRTIKYKYIGDIREVDNNRTAILGELKRAGTPEAVIENADLCCRLLEADLYVQKQIEKMFHKSYYDFILEDLTQNKALWKTTAFITTGDFFLVLQVIHQDDRLKFLGNIGYENIGYLHSLWQIQSVAKLLTLSDRNLFIHHKYFKKILSLKDMLKLLDTCKESIEVQWRVVQEYLGHDRADKILLVLDNNKLPGQADVPVSYVMDMVSMQPKIKEPLALSALKCEDTEQLLLLLQKRTPEQQGLIIEIFGGVKEVKRALTRENRAKGFNSEQEANRYVSFSDFIKACPEEMRLHFLGNTDSNGMRPSETNGLQFAKQQASITPQFDRLDNTSNQTPAMHFTARAETSRRARL